MSSNKVCFIFDLDGTLILNEKANFLAYQATFEHVGLHISQEEYHEYFGLGIEELLAKHAARHGFTVTPELVQEIKSHKSGEYAKRLHLIELNNATVATLKAVAPLHHTALATTASRRNVEAVLQAFDLQRYFDLLVCGEDVSHKKPHPECHQIIADHFGVHPEECIVFEDSAIGVQAATTFGAHVFKVVR